MNVTTHRVTLSSIKQKASSCKHINENLSNKRQVDIRRVKSFVSAHYSKDSAIYDVIMSEDDFLEPSDFVAKLRIWDKLSGREKR